MAIESPEAIRQKERRDRHAAELAQYANQWDIQDDQAFNKHGIRLQTLAKRFETYCNKYLMGGGNLWRMGAFVADDIPDRQIDRWTIFNPHLHLPLPEDMPKEDRWTPQKMMELGVREVNGTIMFGRENIICVQRLDYREKAIARRQQQYQERFEKRTQGDPTDGDEDGEFSARVEESQVEVRPIKKRRERKPRKPRAKRKPKT